MTLRTAASRRCKSRSRACGRAWGVAAGAPARGRIRAGDRARGDRHPPVRGADGRRAHRFGTRVRLLASALALWRGPALADHRFDDFAQAEIARLEELRLEATEERLSAELEHGHAGDLVSELRALVAEHPLRERLRGRLMLALYRSGRQADALETMREGRRLLVDELGLEPGPELRRLEAMILAHDPELDAETVDQHAGRPAPSPANATIGREGELAEIGALLPARRSPADTRRCGRRRQVTPRARSRAGAERPLLGRGRVRRPRGRRRGAFVPAVGSALGVVADTPAELGSGSHASPAARAR